MKTLTKQETVKLLKEFDFDNRAKVTYFQPERCCVIGHLLKNCDIKNAEELAENFNEILFNGPKEISSSQHANVVAVSKLIHKKENKYLHYFIGLDYSSSQYLQEINDAGSKEDFDWFISMLED